jgi:capsular polysaccharide biosynthesis protein
VSPERKKALNLDVRMVFTPMPSATPETEYPMREPPRSSSVAHLAAKELGAKQMDLVEYGRVIRRQAFIVVLGLTVTFALMLLSLVRVSGDGMVLRRPPTYQASSTILVTRAGFPLGQAASPDYQQSTDARMQYLAGVYAQLAKSETVRTVIEHDGTRLPLSRASYDVTQLIEPVNHTPFPLMEVVGVSTSEGGAMAIANRVARGLRRYILVNQNRVRTPEAQRVDLRVVSRADHAEVLQGVKLTTPIMLFMLGLVVTLACAFARDNVKRNRRGPGSQSPPYEPPGPGRVELESVPEEPAVRARVAGGHRRLSTQARRAIDRP